MRRIILHQSRLLNCLSIGYMQRFATSLFLTCIFFCFSLFAEQDFYSLMGKATKHWEFVTQSVDIALLDSAQALYEKNKAKQFTTQGAYKIPPVIHFIWLGPKHFPPESVENVRTWIAHNPGWKVKFWTDRKRLAPCETMQVMYVSDFSFQKLGDYYTQSNNWGEKSDILRYEILYQQGGVYVDHDANCLQSFDGMHKGYDLYCGLETPHLPFVGRSITCGNGVIGSRANHPTIGKVLELIAMRWDSLKHKFRGKDHFAQVAVVVHRTYIALTDALAGTIDQEGNSDILLPAAYFFAKNRIPSLYSQHFYANSWDEAYQKKTDDLRFVKKKLQKLARDSINFRRYLPLIVCFIFFPFICIICLRGFRRWDTK